jgi:hypothetical protein
MPLTISYADWMKNTHSLVKHRSQSLIWVDQAVMARNEAQAKFALISWINEQNTKNQDWHRSVRNTKGTVEKLYKQLNILGAEVAHANFKAELVDYISKKNMMVLQKEAKAMMFKNQKLQLKDSFFGIARAKDDNYKSSLTAVVSSAAGVSYKAAKVARKFKSIEASIQKAIKAITEGLSDDTSNVIVTRVLGETAEQFSIGVAPLFGLLSSGGKAAAGWVDVALTDNNRREMESIRPSIRMGDASEALNAIIQILDRQIMYKSTKASIHTTAFAAKGVGVLVDGGLGTNAVVGAIETVATLLNLLVDFVVEAKEMVAGNKLIAGEIFGLELFEKCPILGCYYLSIQDHSTIMDFDLENMGKGNWQQEAERLKYAITPVIKQAQTLILASRIELPGYAEAKGIHQASRTKKITLYFRNKKVPSEIDNMPRGPQGIHGF